MPLVREFSHETAQPAILGQYPDIAATMAPDMNSALTRQQALSRTPVRASPAGRPAFRRLAVLVAGAMLAACSSMGQNSSSADYSNIGSQATSRGAIKSPASERIVDGIVDTVLSDTLVSSFDEAARRPVKSLRDGQPLYLYIRSTRPLGDLAHPVDPYGQMAFSAYPHLFIQIGDNQSLRIINTCYVTLTHAETKATDLVVPLAPLTNRVGNLPSDCWLETVSRADPVKQTLEVRLAGFAGKFESWLPVPDMLSVQPVEVDLSKGSTAYAAMLRTDPGKAPAVLTARRASRDSQENRAATADAASRDMPAGAASGARADNAQASPSGREAAVKAPATSTTVTEPQGQQEARAQRIEAARAAAAANAGAATGSAAGNAAGSAASGAAAAAGGAAAAGAAAVSGAASAARAGAGNASRNADTPGRGLNEIVPMGGRPTASGQPAAADRAEAAAEQARREEARRKAAEAEAARREAEEAKRSIANLPSGAQLAALTPLRPAPKQAIGTERMAAQLQNLTSTLLGREPSETYFIDRRWQTQPPVRGQRGSRQTMRAIAIFRGEACSWQSLVVTRRAGTSTLVEVLADGDEVMVPCPELQAGA